MRRLVIPAVLLLASLTGVIIHAAPALSVSGVVRIGDAPCPSGEIRLIRAHGELGQISTGRIAPDGRARVGGLAAGRYFLVLACDGVPAKTLPGIELRDRPLTEQTWVLDAGHTLELLVVTSSGAPVADESVSVSAVPYEDGTSAQGSTDEAGRVIFRGLRLGAHEVRADRAGPSHALRVTLERPRTEAKLVLPPFPTRITGKVLDDDGRPASDVFVVGRGPSGWGAGVDAAGGFAIDVVPGKYEVALLASGGAQGMAKPQRIQVAPGETVELVFRLPSRTAVISGRVIDSSGAPVSGALVAAAHAGDTERDARFALTTLRSKRPSVLVRPDGRFELGGLRPGRYVVLAQRPSGEEAIAFGVETGSAVTLELEPPGAISGRVLDGAVPLQGFVELTCTEQAVSKRVALSDAGKFHFDRLPPGAYELRALAGEKFAMAKLTLRPGAREKLDLVLGQGGTIEGRVVDAVTGAPIAGQRVHALDLDLEREPVHTDARGAFRLEHVSPGTVRIHFDARPLEMCPRWMTLEVEAGSTHRLGPVRLRKAQGAVGQMPPNPGFVAGSRDGQPVVVTSVDPAGPAASAGLVVGDEIVSAGGADVTHDPYALSCALEAARGQVRLGLKRGTSVVLPLER